MSILVEVPGVFRSYLNGEKTASAEGSTVGECLRYFSSKFPKTKDMLIDDEGNLQRHFDVYLNGESVHSSGLDTPVNDGDRLDLVYIIHGG